MWKSLKQAGNTIAQPLLKMQLLGIGMETGWDGGCGMETGVETGGGSRGAALSGHAVDHLKSAIQGGSLLGSLQTSVP